MKKNDKLVVDIVIFVNIGQKVFLVFGEQNAIGDSNNLVYTYGIYGLGRIVRDAKPRYEQITAGLVPRFVGVGIRAQTQIELKAYVAAVFELH